MDTTLSQQRPFGVVRHLLVAGGLCWLSGCGASPTGQVTGTVILYQKPVAGAELVFEAVDNPHEQYFGASGDDGQYRVSYRTKKGLPVGTYKVTVTRYSLPEGRPFPTGEEGAVLRSQGVGIKKSFAFETPIVAGPNTVDFVLTSGQEVKNP